VLLRWGGGESRALSFDLAFARALPPPIARGGKEVGATEGRAEEFRDDRGRFSGGEVLRDVATLMAIDELDSLPFPELDHPAIDILEVRIFFSRIAQGKLCEGGFGEGGGKSIEEFLKRGHCGERHVPTG